MFFQQKNTPKIWLFQNFFVPLQSKQVDKRVKGGDSCVMGGPYLLLVLGYERGNWLAYTVRVRQ